VNLSQLVHSTRRLEREAKRAGILDEPPQECPWLKSASLNELVRLTEAGSTLTDLAGGTARIDAEFAEQVKARVDVRARLGLPAVDCVGGVEPEPRLEVDGRPTPLRIAFDINPRSERTRLWRDVDGRPQMFACDCLSDALDAAGALSPASDKAVLRDAKRRHKAFAKEAAKQEAERTKRQVVARPEPNASPAPIRHTDVTKPAPEAPPPKREVLETNTRPRTHVVKRKPRWYDEPEKRRSIMDMKF
jgi:hypothetical protein